MPTYRSYGPLDSQILVDGDVGFARMNARMRPEQLQRRCVVFSERTHGHRWGLADTQGG